MFACGMGTVASCAQCMGMPESCVYCQMGSPTTLAGVCQMPGQSCNGAAPNGFQSCPCMTGPSSCPEAYQVCRNGVCRTCGDSFNDNGLMCQGGGTCHTMNGMCM
jgi:hypothetical protein